MSDTRRSLNTSFWTDPYIEELDSDTTYVFLCLLLNPQTGLGGVFEISTKRIAQYTKLPTDRVEKSLRRLQDDGKIMSYKQWIAIKNHIKNQSLNPNMAWQVVQILRKVPMPIRSFILLDDEDRPMPWLNDFLSLITQYMTTQEDRKRAAEQDKKPYRRVLTHYTDFNTGYDFAVLIDDLNDGVKVGENGGNPYLTLTQPLGNPRGRAVAGALQTRKGKGKGKGNMNNADEFFSDFDPEETQVDPPETVHAPWHFQDLWNSFPALSTFKQIKGTVSTSVLEDIRLHCLLYSAEEVEQAIRNYGEAWTNRDRYEFVQTYPTLLSFMSKGVGSFTGKLSDRVTLKPGFIASAKPSQPYGPNPEAHQWDQTEEPFRD